MDTRSKAMFTAASRCDPGYQRPRNEDRVLADAVGGVFAVVDGMGGHPCGDVAAELAVETFAALANQAAGPEALAACFLALNQRLLDASEARALSLPMGCVATVTWFEDRGGSGRYWVGHVGDTRAWLFWSSGHKGGRQLTRDHSLVSASLSEVEALESGARHIVTNAIGLDLREQTKGWLDITEGTLAPGELLLMCTDGVSDFVPIGRLAELVLANADDVDGLLDAIVTAARARQETSPKGDNIGLVATRSTGTPATIHPHVARAPDRAPQAASREIRGAVSAEPDALASREIGKDLRRPQRPFWFAPALAAGGLSIGVVVGVLFGLFLPGVLNPLVPDAPTILTGDSLHAAVAETCRSRGAMVGQTCGGPVAVKANVAADLTGEWTSVIVTQDDPAAVVILKAPPRGTAEAPVPERGQAMVIGEAQHVELDRMVMEGDGPSIIDIGTGGSLTLRGGSWTELQMPVKVRVGQDARLELDSVTVRAGGIEVELERGASISLFDSVVDLRDGHSFVTACRPGARVRVPEGSVRFAQGGQVLAPGLVCGGEASGVAPIWDGGGSAEAPSAVEGTAGQ